MRKTEYVLVAAFALSLATWSSAGETAEAVRPPARGPGAAMLTTPGPALVPVSIPHEAKPPVQTTIAEEIGA